MRIGLAAAMMAALLGAGAAAAAPTDSELFCHDLKRLIEAAEYDGGFEQMYSARPAPPRLGFARGCRPGARTWFCHQSLAPDSLSHDALAAGVAACLPEAKRQHDGLYRETLFTLPRARIRIEERGGPGAHVGRIVTLVVEATAAR